MRYSIAATAVLLLLPLAAHAQKPTDVVHWSAKAPAVSVRAGGATKVELTAQIEDGWHLYGMKQNPGGPPPLAIVAAEGSAFEITRDTIVAPKATTTVDPNFNLETQYYEGKATFSVPVVATSAAKSGTQSMSIAVTFQACNDRICLRPATQALSVDLTVGPAGQPRQR